MTLRAPASGSTANGCAVECRVAARTLSAGFPAVGKKPVRRVGPVVADDSDGGAADPANLFPHAAGLRLVQRAGRRGRVDLGAPEDFVGHPVADAREMFLHEEHGLERGAAAAFEEAGEA